MIDAASRRLHQSYSTVAVALHWIIAAALVLQLFLGWRMADLSGAQRSALLQLHKSIGISILLLVLVRLLWRMRVPPPKADPSLKRWERVLSTAVHRSFYAIMLTLPLTGWALISISRGGATTHLFGLLPWPRLPWLAHLPSDAQDAVSGFLDGSHVVLVWAMIVLVVLHAIGALKHHFISRDRLMTRMAPWIRPGVLADVRLLIIPAFGLIAAAVAYAPQPEASVAPRPKPTELAHADIFLDVVQPALSHRCESCHNDENTRGGLSVQSYAALMEGGLHGHTVIPGTPSKSELVRRVRIAAGDEQHMPRNGHVPLSAAQIQTIEWWIAQGAPPSAPVESVALTPEVRMAFLKVLKLGRDEAANAAASDEDSNLPEVAAADPKVVAALEADDFVVRRMTQNSNLLEVEHFGPRPLSDTQLFLLDAIASQIVGLNLSKAQLTDAGMASIARMSRLRHLRLEWNPIDDAGAAKLEPLMELRYLNLSGSKLTDRGLDALSRLQRLRTLAVWSTGVSPDGVEAVKKKRPDLAVEAYSQFSVLMPEP